MNKNVPKTSVKGSHFYKVRSFFTVICAFLFFYFPLSAAEITGANASNLAYWTEGNTIIFTDTANITLTEDTTIRDLFIRTGNKTVTIDLNGYTLTILVRIRLGQTPTGHLVFTNGTVITKEFDTNDDGNNSLQLTQTSLTVTTQLLVNGNGTTTITGTSPCAFIIPSTFDMQYAEAGDGNVLYFPGDLKPTVKSGNYTITTTGTPGPGQTVTINITSEDASSNPVNFTNITYKATITGTGETYIVQGPVEAARNITATTTQTLTNTADSNTMDITVTIPQSVVKAHGIEFAIYEGSSTANLLGSPIFYTQQYNETTWTGATDNDWDKASNWTHGVPAAGMNVVIANAGSAPQLVSASNVINQITVNSGATLTIAAGGQLNTDIFTNNGTVTNNGTIQATGDVTTGTNFTSTSGSIILNGGTAQEFNGGTNTFNSITVNKTGGTIAFNGNFSANSFTISRGPTVTFNGKPSVTTFADNATTGAITFNAGCNLTDDVVFNTTGTVTLGGTFSTGSLTFTGPVSLNDNTAITTNASSDLLWFKKALTGNTSTSFTVNTGKTQFDGNVSDLTTLTTAETVINCSSITTSGAQSYGGDVTVSKTTVTLTAQTTSISFAGNIAASGKKIIIDTPSLASTNTSAASQIQASEIALSQELTLSSATGGGIELNAKVTGSDYKLINSADLTLASGITVETAIENTGSLTCSNATFANDVDLSAGSFTHSAGTIELTAATNSPATLAGSNNTFVNIKISGSVNITGSNTFTDFTATDLAGKTITFTDSTKQTVNGTLKLSGKTGNNNKLTLTSSGSGKWEIDCANAPETLAYLIVSNSNNTSTDNTPAIIVFTASNSTDNGGNINWAFPGQTYQWIGEAAEGSKTNWQNALNWSPASLPGSGATVSIAAGKDNYPQLSAHVDIGTGTVTIANNASLDFNGYSFTAGTISNSGTVRLKGTETISATTITNANTSTVEYYGDGTLSAFNWKNGQFNNLILLRSVNVSDAITVNGTTQILAGTGTVNLDNANNIFGNTVTIGNSTTSAGTVTLSGKKTNGGAAITLADGVYAAALTLNSRVQGADLTINAPLTVNAVSITTTGNQTYNDTVLLKAETTTFTSGSGKTIEFTDTVTGDAGTESLITTGGTVVFDAAVNVGTLSTQAATISCSSIQTGGSQTYGGAVSITSDVTLTAAAGDTIQFSGAITGSGSLTTVTGNSIFNGTINGLSSINTAATATFKNTVSVGALTTNTVNINTASITTTGTQTYNGVITLAPSGRQTTLTASGDGSQILLKANVGSTNSSSLTTAGVLIIGNNGGSGINVSVPLTVQNDVSFYSENTLTSLTATSMGGKTITFEAEKKQTFSGKLSLSGADGNLLVLKSSAPGTAWQIYCSGADNHSINYVDVKDSDNSQSSYYLNALSSIDRGNNTKWAFPNMPYTWTGANNSTDWSDPQNWSPQSVPNAGAQILIPASTLEYPVPEYPVIDETISLTHTTNTGSITIENDASLGLTTNGQLTLGTITNGGTVEVSDGTLTVTTLVNNQTVNITGGQIVIPNTSGATFTNNSTVNISGGTITGTRNNGNDSVVIYNGTGDTSPVWGNDYKNLQIDNGCSVSFANDITVANDFTNNGSASIAASKKINVAGDVTSTGDITGDGTLNFNGTSDQTFTPNNKNYPAITASAAGSGSLTIDGKLNAASINSARTTKLNDTITTTGAQTYSGAVILEGNTELAASEIQFLSTVSGDHSLTTTGTTKIKGNITTKGGQTYNNTVNLLAGVTLTDDAGELIQFGSTLSGNFALTVSDADCEFDDTVEIGSLRAVNANINCASITTTTTQAYSGVVTLTQSPTLTGTALTFGGDVKSSAIGTSRTITFDKCSSVNNTSANVSADISYEFTNTSASTVTTAFTPGTSTYHNITSQNITLNFGDNAFTQASDSTFTVNSGTVNMGSAGVSLGNLTVDGGTFQQTGEADDSVNNITFNSGSIIWDSSDAGGTLAINGVITGTSVANINYHKKEVTINATQSVSGVFWSLVIPAGVSITNGDSIRIRKNLTIESTGSYVHNGKILTFGTDAEDGEITDNNTTPVNLGTVVLNKTSAESKLQAKTNLLFTDLTVTKGTFDIPSGKTVQTTNLTIETNGKLANAETLNVTGNMTDSGTYIGDGTIYFTGTGNQNFTPKAGTAALHTTYKNIVNTSANPLNIKADIWAENFVIDSGETTTFEQKSEIGNLTIISAQETNFAKYASIESLTDSPTAGDIVFTEGAVINDDTELITTGTVTFNQTVDIGENGNKTFEHTTGDTVINGTLNASSAKFEDLQLNGTVDAITELYGNLTTTASPAGSATFTQNVSVLGNTDADLDAPVTVQDDFIIQKDSGKAVNIKQNLSITQNFALYSGDVKLKANIFTGKDVIMLGSDYSTNDTSTGYTNAYAYNTPRPNDNWSQPRFDDFSDSVKAGSLEADAGTIIHVGKNFYANGITLNNSTINSGTWYIDIPVTSDSESAFAEAYKCTVNRCTVRKHDGTTAAGTVDSDNAQIVAENGCTLTDCAYWDSAEFEIVNVWTTRDNVVYVEFNRPVRNLHGEFNDAISNFTYFVSADNDTSYSSAATQPDGSEALTSDDAGERTIIYLVAPVTWNTDATGSSAGNAKSTDRNGYNKTSVPYIDIPRSLGADSTASQSYVITDRFGKRLKHYSGSSRITTVLDKTGPVLVEVRTGQETHETALSNQAAYDAHNFIEFIYSEAVNFGAPAGLYMPVNNIPVQNIQVTPAMGYINSSTDLTFAGLNQKIASGKIFTKQAETDTQDVNALYRDSTHSIKYSLAGYASNVSTAGAITGTYIIWQGYIEEAQLPSGLVTGTATPALPNSNVTDCALDLDGTTPLYNPQIMNKTDLAVDNSLKAGTNYGPWDTQAPQFVKVHKHGEDAPQDYYEALGNGDGSTLNRIEMHISDNPSSSDSYNKYWLTGYGWTSDPSGTLLDSAADNLTGGSRPFEASNSTSGALRYCTIVGQQGAFKYEVGETDNPTQSFTAIAESASAPFFTGASDTRHNIPLEKDNTYISLSLSDTSLPYKTTFTVSYDSTSSYITDLAGNRLKSVNTMKTLDLSSPDYKISFSPVNQNKIFLIFLKQLTKDIKYNNNSISQSFEEIIPYCFELGTISGNTWTANSGTALQIDTSVPASIIKSKSNSYFTAVELTLNRDVTMEDIETTYIRLKNANGYSVTSKDPITGLDNSYVTFIQDEVGNYMPMYQAHALSDFAANMVNPLYAYNDDIEFRDENLTYSLYEPESWAVHDWNKEQQNYGTLLAQKPVTVISNLDTSYFADDSGNLKYTLRMFYSKNPTAGSESDEYNADIHDSLRIWAPDDPNSENSQSFIHDGLFPAYAAVTNQNYAVVDAVPLGDDLSKGVKFNFNETTAQSFTHGSQISFLFGVFDASGTVQKSICLNPVLTMSGGSASYNVSAQTPLYIIRLKNSSDITSMDLWSFRVKSVAAQRGNVSIMNNVINADKGEKVVIKVDLKQSGNLNVLVMTLDGNIVDYLQRGEAEEGEHFYSWDGTNRRGRAVARGMYFVRVTGPGIDETRKVLVVK